MDSSDVTTCLFLVTIAKLTFLLFQSPEEFKNTIFSLKSISAKMVTKTHPAQLDVSSAILMIQT